MKVVFCRNFSDLPRGLTEKILAHRDKIEGELKHVAVLFCDMANFTPVVERLGSESYSSGALGCGYLLNKESMYRSMKMVFHLNL